MMVSILGRLEVSEAGMAIEVRRPKERALLTLLAADMGRAVSTDRLVDGLWGESPPATAIKTLQNYVHHLRSLLPENAIETVDGGYRLIVDPMDVDVHRFATEVAEARAALDRNPLEALEGLRAALSLWRGVPFLDADNADTLVPQRTRLGAIRLQAIADANDALIRTGREAETLPDLRSLLDEHPLQEDLWALYILALYRIGRQGEALRAFAEARRVLANELGIDPGPELRNLEASILNQEPSLLETTVAETSSQDVPDSSRVEDGAASPMEERRLITLVMAELTGYEELLIAAGSERGTLIVGDAIGAMSATLERLGGTVARRGEDSVLAMFGAPVARETDTYRAIRAALAVVSEMTGLETEVREGWGTDALGVRCAVHSRSLTVPYATETELQDSSDELGAMLETAPSASVLVDDHTRQLMDDLFTWEEPRPSSGASVARTVMRSPDKARMGRRLSTPLTGRASETATLEELMVSLRRGIGGVVIIRGEAGVGKTRLATDFREAHAADVGWLIGNCAAFAEATPYWPFREMLRYWLNLGIDDTDLKARVALHQRLDEVVGQKAADLYPYLGGVLGVALEPAEAARLDLAPESLQYRTFEVMGALLESLASEAPAVVVIEDVHWSDPTSIQLIERLLPLSEQTALLLIVTTRHDPDHPSQRFFEAAHHRFPHLTRDLDLQPLGPEDQAAMLRQLIGTAHLPEEAKNRILRLAEGNPFYLEELVGSLIDQGTLRETSSGWAFDSTAPVAVPETVEKVVQARIDRLDPDAHELMTSASVLGRSFGLPLLQGLVGSGIRVVDAIHTLLRLDLLVEAQRWPHAEYLFRHELIAEASYQTLRPVRRAELHGRAAEWLERRYEGNLDEVAGQLARHWSRAGNEDRAVEALLRAADLARRDHALDEAIDHYRELLATLERRGDRQTTALVLFKLALAQHTSLRFAESNATYQRAFEMWAPEPSPPATATLCFSSPPFFNAPDPVRSYHLQDMQLQMALFDRLVERWPDDTIVPSLAERWEISADGLSYRFTLREGLAWSDGQPLTAHDAAFGLLRNLDPERPGISVAMLFVIRGALAFLRGESTDPDTVGIRALDDRVLELKLIAPAPYLLGMLNRPDCGPQPRHAVDTLGDDWASLGNEVVSGAFGRRSQTPDTVTLERRADYGRPRLGNVRIVEWQQNPPGEAIDSFQRGEQDLLWISGTWDAAGLDGLPDHAIRFEPAAGLIYLVLNHRNPDVSDQRPRRALAHGIDRTHLARIVPPHTTVAHGGVVPPALAGHTPDIAPSFDPELGRRLLEESGLSTRIRFAYYDRPESHLALLCEATSEMWREYLHIDVEVKQYDLEAWVTLEGSPSDPHVWPSYWYPGYTDPEYFLRLLLHSDAADNSGRFSHPPFDRLVERAMNERNERARLELFHEADRMAVTEQAAVIPLSYARNVSVVRPGVDGWWEFGKSWANFADITLTSPG